MERAITLQQMLEGLWRRRLLVLVTFAAVLVVGTAVVLGMPKVWRASTVVRVEAHRVAPELVSPSVLTPVEERLKTLAQELFARPLLERTITELDLEKDLRKERGMDAAVEALRAQLDVKVEGEAAFVLSVTGDDPKTVAKIANLLPKLYADEALELRAEQAQATSAMFDEEIKRLSKDVQARETTIAAFKLQHLGELPEQAEANMRALDRLMVLLTTRTDARRELQRRQSDLSAARLGADTELGRLKRSELDLDKSLLDAHSQWTPDHPEVQRLERERDATGRKRAQAEAKAQDEDESRNQVRRQLVQVDQELAGYQKEASLYRERLDRTPQWAQQLSEITRDYEILRTKYQSLVSRKVEAEVARELEARARATTFHVLSPAAEPAAPFKPERGTAMLLVLLAAVGLSVLAGVVREMQDDSLRRAEQARELEVPVLALVPRIRSAGAKVF
ncbi:MAG TPA: Wzz/FepE/Etk N-terminal domain-containing protein [Myxococcales bacterium]